MNVALNPALPLDLLETLVSDSNHNVRLAVLGNPNLPLAWLERLLHDPNSKVRQSTGKGLAR